jgi:hypothetical protein
MIHASQTRLEIRSLTLPSTHDQRPKCLQTVKPGDEALFSGDGDRVQESPLANAANESVDVTEGAHPFADTDGVYSDVLHARVGPAARSG